MKTYVTFGQDHIHRVNGQLLDKDCVAIVNGDRNKVNAPHWDICFGLLRC